MLLKESIDSRESLAIYNGANVEKSCSHHPRSRRSSRSFSQSSRCPQFCSRMQLLRLTLRHWLLAAYGSRGQVQPLSTSVKNLESCQEASCKRCLQAARSYRLRWISDICDGVWRRVQSARWWISYKKLQCPSGDSKVMSPSQADKSSIYLSAILES